MRLAPLLFAFLGIAAEASPPPAALVGSWRVERRTRIQLDINPLGHAWLREWAKGEAEPEIDVIFDTEWTPEGSGQSFLLKTREVRGKNLWGHHQWNWYECKLAALPTDTLSIDCPWRLPPDAPRQPAIKGNLVLRDLRLHREQVSIPLAMDIVGNLYEKEIRSALADGLLRGFADGHFRPHDDLTREQTAAILLSLLSRIQGLTVEVPATVAVSPFSDVETSRWSAPAIAALHKLGIAKGIDGKFMPDKQVSRAELSVFFLKAAEVAHAQRQVSGPLRTRHAAPGFTDISNHWARESIEKLATWCRAATPLKEQGTAFAPDRGATRGYAAAVAVRSLNCLQEELP